MTFHSPLLLHGLWIILLHLVTLWAVLRHRAHQPPLIGPRLAPGLVLTASGGQKALSHAMFALALACMVVAAARPQGKRSKIEVTGFDPAADILVVLDVSKSMLADDAAPTRLARAKDEIIELTESLTQHRVGLIVFAGRAVVASPLTADHAFFRLALRQATPNSVSLGGTRIGKALSTALTAFPNPAVPRLIVLVTDGEDHDDEAVRTAEMAKKEGVHIVTVGFGSEKGVPLYLLDSATGVRTPVKHRGELVVSKLNATLLRDIAEKTGGAYVPAQTAALDLDSIVRKIVVPLLEGDGQNRALFTAKELYPYFMLAAFLLGLAGLGVTALPRAIAPRGGRR